MVGIFGGVSGLDLFLAIGGDFSVELRLRRPVLGVVGSEPGGGRGGDLMDCISGSGLATVVGFSATIGGGDLTPIKRLGRGLALFERLVRAISACYGCFVQVANDQLHARRDRTWVRKQVKYQSKSSEMMTDSIVQEQCYLRSAMVQ